MTTCTRCEGSGFLNVDQLNEVAPELVDADWGAIKAWCDAHTEEPEHDICVCDCCGNGDSWYGTPGEHYGPNDPSGRNGPYAYNGGLCECH